MLYENPVGTNGFAFLEFTTRDANTLAKQFESLGFNKAYQHRTKDVIIYQQDKIKFIINNQANHHTKEFSTLHGPSTCAMGFYVKDAKAALEHALKNGATAYQPEEHDDIYHVPAIYGVGGSIIYFIDDEKEPRYLSLFTAMADANQTHAGLTYLDHVTHNLHRGNMTKWADFYTRIFNFREIRYFDIEGKLTGLKSRAMTSPCGKIRIPLNESSDDKSQIEEFLKEFNGEGIQHIALGTADIYSSVEVLGQKGIDFLETPDTYYELINTRLPDHGESIEALTRLRILIDGHTMDEKKLLLQIFTKNMLGPVFFEIIQRKGDEGFGEGNFKALFESIELDQIRRGVLDTTSS